MSPQVAVNGGGEGFAAWQESSTVDGAFAQEVWGARYNTADGGAWQPVERVAAGGYSAATGIDEGGNLFVVYNDGAELFGGRLANGEEVWSTQLLSGQAIVAYPQVSVDTAGNALAVWARGGVYATRYPADGSAWEAPTDLAGDGGGAWARFSGNEAGHAAAVWRQNVEGGGYAVVAARFEPTSASWYDAETLKSPDADNSAYPTVRVASSGDVFAVWMDSGNLESRRYQADGGFWRGLRRVGNTGTSLGADMGFLPNGAVVALWVTESHGVRATLCK